MVEAIVKAVIWILVLVALVFGFLYILGLVGVVLPSIIVTIIWIIVALIGFLIVYTLLKQSPIGGYLP